MTNFANINQKMCSFIRFGEVSVFRRVIIPFDPLPSQNNAEKRGGLKIGGLEYGKDGNNFL